MMMKKAKKKSAIVCCWEPTSDDEIYEKYTRRIKKTPDVIRPLSQRHPPLSFIHLKEKNKGNSSCCFSFFSFQYVAYCTQQMNRSVFIHHERFRIMTAHLFEFYDAELI